MKRILLFGLFALALLGLSACNTIAGVGKDVEKVGEVLTEEAEEARN